MASNVFGNPITDGALKAMEKYKGKTSTRKERAYEALITKNADNKYQNAVTYVKNLKEQWGTGISTECVIYNATGDPVNLMSTHDWHGHIGPGPYPINIENGQWGAFLHVKTSGTATGSSWAINVGGGFHHCSADRGGGFCVYADISLCIHYAFVQLNVLRVMIIDLDAHQGNGHEMDFSNDSRVYILDVYNPRIYPLDYEARRYIDQKVEVVSGTTTDEYLRKLDEALEVAGGNFDPELVVYNAGTDILDGDPLGRLKISPEGITTRDEKVFRFARQRNVPILMLTSGGYMKSSARVIADSIANLSRKSLIDMGSSSVKL